MKPQMHLVGWDDDADGLGCHGESDLACDDDDDDDQNPNRTAILSLPLAEKAKALFSYLPF